MLIRGFEQLLAERMVAVTEPVGGAPGMGMGAGANASASASASSKSSTGAAAGAVANSSVLCGVRLGIDAAYWVRRLLSQLRDPAPAALGAYPLRAVAFRALVIRDISWLRSHGVMPLVVFPGLGVHLQPRRPFNMEYRRGTRQSRAWREYYSGALQAAYHNWMAALPHASEVFPVLMSTLDELGVEFMRAPYSSVAQLYYLMTAGLTPTSSSSSSSSSAIPPSSAFSANIHNNNANFGVPPYSTSSASATTPTSSSAAAAAAPEAILHAVYAGSDMLLFEVPRVITAIDPVNSTFTWISRPKLLRCLGLRSSEQLLDCALLVGFDWLPTCPELAGVASSLVASAAANHQMNPYNAQPLSQAAAIWNTAIGIVLANATGFNYILSRCGSDYSPPAPKMTLFSSKSGSGGTMCTCFKAHSASDGTCPEVSLPEFANTSTASQLASSGIMAMEDNVSKQFLFYRNIYAKARCAVRYHPVYQRFGDVAPIGHLEAPADLHVIFGPRFTRTAYTALARCIVDPNVLSPLVCGIMPEFSPVCGGECAKYKALLELLHEWRAHAVTAASLAFRRVKSKNFSALSLHSNASTSSKAQNFDTASNCSTSTSTAEYFAQMLSPPPFSMNTLTVIWTSWHNPNAEVHLRPTDAVAVLAQYRCGLPFSEMLDQRNAKPYELNLGSCITAMCNNKVLSSMAWSSGVLKIPVQPYEEESLAYDASVDSSLSNQKQGKQQKKNNNKNNNNNNNNKKGNANVKANAAANTKAANAAATVARKMAEETAARLTNELKAKILTPAHSAKETCSIALCAMSHLLDMIDPKQISATQLGIVYASAIKEANNRNINPDHVILAFELLKLGFLEIDTPTSKQYGSSDISGHINIISKIGCLNEPESNDQAVLENLKHEASVPPQWEGPFDRDMLRFSSGARACMRALRNMFDGLLLGAIAMRGVAYELKFSDFKPNIPFFSVSPNAAGGIIVQNVLCNAHNWVMQRKLACVDDLQRIINESPTLLCARGVKSVHQEIRKSLDLFDIVSQYAPMLTDPQCKAPRAARGADQLSAARNWLLDIGLLSQRSRSYTPSPTNMKDKTLASTNSNPMCPSPGGSASTCSGTCTETEPMPSKHQVAI